jgi:hypothetical protein
MSKDLEARLVVLSVEIQTVSLLRHTSENQSAYQLAAMERELELENEISRLHRLLGRHETGVSSLGGNFLWDS